MQAPAMLLQPKAQPPVGTPAGAQAPGKTDLEMCVLPCVLLWPTTTCLHLHMLMTMHCLMTYVIACRWLIAMYMVFVPTHLAAVDLCMKVQMLVLHGELSDDCMFAC